MVGPDAILREKEYYRSIHLTGNGISPASLVTFSKLQIMGLLEDHCSRTLREFTETFRPAYVANTTTRSGSDRRSKYHSLGVTIPNHLLSP